MTDPPAHPARLLSLLRAQLPRFIGPINVAGDKQYVPLIVSSNPVWDLRLHVRLYPGAGAGVRRLVVSPRRKPRWALNTYCRREPQAPRSIWG